MLRKAGFILFTICCTVDIQAQSIYVASGSGQGLRKVSVTSGGCISSAVTGCPSQNYFAIARFRDTLYFTSNTFLYKAVIMNDALQDCQPVVPTPVSMTSLTVDSNGIIYSANNTSLYRYDPVNGTGFLKIEEMPFISAGDMIFYLGELYMASTQGIVKVNIADPGASSLHIPMNSQAIYGMAVLPVDCIQNKAYVFETTAAGDGTNMIELDLTGQQLVGITCQLPFGVSDAASEVEGGFFSSIEIQEIKILPQCKEPGKGMIRVIRQPGLADYTYVLNGTVSNNNGVFEHLDPGTYHIEVMVSGGCSLDTLINVPLFNTPSYQIEEHRISPDCAEGGKVWFTFTPDYGNNRIIHSISNNIDTVSAGFVFSNLSEGAHHFRIVDENFCGIEERDIIISLEGSCDTLYFPSAFTPNNDGRNDYFRGSGNRSVKDYSLTVYNRWGEVVFTTTNVLSGWNGKVKDAEQDAGIYIWVATYSNKAGLLKKRKGTVMLIR